jgi:hypothetical protein
MKAIKYTIWIMLFFTFLFSCSSRKKSVEKERIITVYDTILKRDSVFVDKLKIVTLPSVNTEVISNPCDSVGNLKVIEKVIRIPYGSVEIKSDGNNLIAKVNTDSISSVYENHYKERNEKQLHQISKLEKENTTLKIIPFNWWKLVGIISLIANILLVGIIVKNKLIKWK